MGLMDGKTCIVTGANGGIGVETSLGLAREGARVVMVCRDRAKGERVLADVKQRSGRDTVELALCDFASFKDIRRLADDLRASHPRIDVLVNNAGSMNGTRSVTVDGLETTFAVNHLGYFLLTNLLLDVLKKSAPSRVVNVSSDAHRRGHIRFDDLNGEKQWSALGAYCDSKLANVLFTRELARRLAGTGVTTNAVHPGVVNTGFGSTARGPFKWGLELIRPFMRTPEKGARTSLRVATDPALATVSGKYFANEREETPSKRALDDAVAARLWTVSEELTGLATGARASA